MGVVDGLFADKGFIIQSLLSLIEEERLRVTGSGLIKRESCDRFLNSFITKLGSDAPNLTNDQIIAKLTQLYDSMQNVRIMGDRFFEEESKANTPTPVQQPEIQDKVAEQVDQMVKVADFVSGRLEQMAYKLGCAGNHIMAYEVEKVIKNLKGE